MKTMKIILATLLCFLSAVAASVTHTATVFPNGTDWSITNSVPKFDSSIGTLTNVIVSIAVNANTGHYFENRDTVPGTATVSSVVTGFASLVALSASTTFTNAYTGTTSADDGVLDYGGTGGFAVQTSGSSSGQNSTTNVVSFVGVGTVPLVASASSNGLYSGPGDFYFFVQTSASALITVTYEFTPPVCDPKDCDKDTDNKDGCKDSGRGGRKKHR